MSTKDGLLKAMARLLCNSIPKSGTYLLAQIAKYFGFRDQNIRFVDSGTNIVDNSNKLTGFEPNIGAEKFDMLQDGYYAPSHVSYTADVSQYLCEAGIKHLFIFRHPLDVLYSYVRFVTYSASFRAQCDYNSALQDRMLNGFANDEQRVIDVYKNMMAAFNFESNQNWLRDPSCFSVSFESLYSALIEAESGATPALLQKLVDYMEFKSSWSPEALFERVYGHGPTFAKGKDKIGQFKSLDAASLEELTCDPHLAAIISAYGY